MAWSKLLTYQLEQTISFIDLVYLSSLDFVEEFGISPAIADHEGTTVYLKIKQKPKLSKKNSF